MLFGASYMRDGERIMCGNVADFTSFSFHAVKNLTTAEGGALTWRPIEGFDDEYIYKQFMLLSLTDRRRMLSTRMVRATGSMILWLLRISAI